MLLDSYTRLCANLPKAELHLHIEGTLSPMQRLSMARRNRLPSGDIPLADLEAARNFGSAGTPQGDLSQMLAYYYDGIDVLRTEKDFFELTVAHLSQCHIENVCHVELSFDPQAHTSRGLPFATVIHGLRRGIQAGEAMGVHAQLVMCLHRDRSVESAFEALSAAEYYRGWISGIGLDSAEQGNPPVKFKSVYDEARAQGYRLTAHCDVDQQNAVRHIWQCIDILEVDRIDHGINCLEDPALVAVLRERGTCLTACPTWRPRDPGPRRVDRMREMLDQGLRVTMNSDDPGVLSSGTLGDLMPHVGLAGRFSAAELAQFMINAFEGSWLPETDRQRHVQSVQHWLRNVDSKLLATLSGGMT